MRRKTFTSIDDYILASPKEVRSILRQIRSEIKNRVPTATESISYNLPAFKDSKTFIYFAGFKNHIGVYPPVKDKLLKKKLKKYMNAKGNLAFPLSQEMPYKLIGDIAHNLWRQYLPSQKIKKICSKGHVFYKSSDCPTCPTCAKLNKPKHGFLALLGSPARRSLTLHKITTLKKLSGFSEADLLKLHGVGPSSLPILRKCLKDAGLKLKK